jgi:hypothetical protein
VQLWTAGQEKTAQVRGRNARRTRPLCRTSAVKVWPLRTGLIPSGDWGMLGEGPAALRYDRGLSPFHLPELGDVPVRRLQAGQDTLA